MGTGELLKVSECRSDSDSFVLGVSIHSIVRLLEAIYRALADLNW